MWLIIGRKRLPTPSASLLHAATVIGKELLPGCLALFGRKDLNLVLFFRAKVEIMETFVLIGDGDRERGVLAVFFRKTIQEL